MAPHCNRYYEVHACHVNKSLQIAGDHNNSFCETLCRCTLSSINNMKSKPLFHGHLTPLNVLSENFIMLIEIPMSLKHRTYSSSLPSTSSPFSDFAHVVIVDVRILVGILQRKSCGTKHRNPTEETNLQTVEVPNFKECKSTKPLKRLVWSLNIWISVIYKLHTPRFYIHESILWHISGFGGGKRTTHPLRVHHRDFLI